MGLVVGWGSNDPLYDMVHLGKTWGASLTFPASLEQPMFPMFSWGST